MQENYFQERDHSAIHAEGDTDTIIVIEALKIAQEKHITVIEEIILILDWKPGKYVYSEISTL